MLKDITLGQYYQTESVIHRLDPRVKLVGTIAYIVSLFLVNDVWGYLVAALFLAAMIKLSNVPFKFMVKGMKAIMFLLMLTVVFNMFLTPGEALISVWKLTITKEGPFGFAKIMKNLNLSHFNCSNFNFLLIKKSAF